MRIALVNQPWGHVVPPVTRGGSIPILIYEMARRLAEQHEVTFYTRGAFRGQVVRESNVDFEYIPVAIDKVFYRLQGKVRVFPESQLQPFWASDWCFRQFGEGVANSTRRRGCDVVHIVNYSQFVPIVRRRNPDARIILHMECEWLNQIDRKLALERISQSDMVIGCSQYITRRIQEAFPQYADRCRTLYNGVFVDRFRPVDRSARNGDSRIIFCARIAPEKGIHTLIDAFALIADRFPNLQLDLVGPDEIIPPNQQVTICDDPEVLRLAPFYEGDTYRRHLQELIKGHGLESRIKFHGNVGHSEGLVELYQQADVAVMPSIWDEPFGIPVIEAMATGIPVIVTRVGAFPELIQDGQTGLIVNRADPQALANAIERLVSDPAARDAMGQAAHRRAVEEFSWSPIVEQLEGHYRDAMQQTPVPAAGETRGTIPVPAALTAATACSGEILRALRQRIGQLLPSRASTVASLCTLLIILILPLDGPILRLLQPVASVVAQSEISRELKELGRPAFALILAGLVGILHVSRWRGAALIVTSALLAKGFYAITRVVLERPRPVTHIAPYDFPNVDALPVRLLEAPSFYWPSGHTVVAFSLAAAMSCLLPRGRWVFFGVAAILGLQRIGELAHYPSEIVLFACLGALSFRLARRIVRNIPQGQSTTAGMQI